MDDATLRALDRIKALTARSGGIPFVGQLALGLRVLAQKGHQDAATQLHQYLIEPARYAHLSRQAHDDFRKLQQFLTDVLSEFPEFQSPNEGPAEDETKH